MRHPAMALATLALTLVALAGPALAGGWAVTTFDDLPGEFVAGTSYTLGYTIRQHGVTPVNVERTEILAIGTSGKTLSFSASRDGGTGHYSAKVTFPASGSYTWQVTQLPFGPQDLGTIVVLAVPSAAAGNLGADVAPATTRPAASSDPARAALPFAAAGAAILFAWRLLTIVRGVRRTRATA